MKDDNIEHCRCPFCKSEVEVDVSWVKKNGNTFCGSCCKSFALRIEEDEEEHPNEKVTKSEKDGYDYWG
jgi:transcription elongation factor Elf1